MSRVFALTFPKQKNIPQLLQNGLIIALWAWLYAPIFPYFKVIFGREDFRTNQWVLVGVLALIGWQWYRGEIRPNLFAPPHLNTYALVLLLLCSQIYLLNERFFDVNTLSACCFFLASYGLIGLWLSPARWQKGLPAAILLVLTLPIGMHIDTFIGYPVRVMTAKIVQQLFMGLGIHSVNTDTVLMIENKVAHVDLPCSGVKSLWTGTLFLVAATWLEQKRLDFQWGLIAIVFTVTLLIGNTFRVAALILVGQVGNWMLGAEILHVPLGIFAFVVSCGLAAFLLRLRRSDRISADDDDLIFPLQQPTWLSYFLLVTIASMALVYAQRPIVAQASQLQSADSWSFSAELHAVRQENDEILNETLFGEGAESVERYRFDWHGLRGSMLLVNSRSWRAHHNPKGCFSGTMEIINSETKFVSDDFPIQLMTMESHKQEKMLSAAYWFQSPSQTTNDYATRIWADLRPHRPMWTMITILFEDEIEIDSAEALQLYHYLQTTIYQKLNTLSHKEN